jgi:hypothetical protein
MYVLLRQICRDFRVGLFWSTLLLLVHDHIYLRYLGPKYICQSPTGELFNGTLIYGGPGQKYRDYSAFGQITGLCPCKLQAPSGTRLAGQPVLRGVIAIFIAGLSVYPLFEFGASAGLQRLRAYSLHTFDRVLRTQQLFPFCGPSTPHTYGTPESGAVITRMLPITSLFENVPILRMDISVSQPVLQYLHDHTIREIRRERQILESNHSCAPCLGEKPG